ncbi:MAG TPA: hypothetical protein VIH24_06195 [Candidatus Limnocylindria bacterium]
MTRRVMLAVLGLLVAGCRMFEPQPANLPADPDAEMRPDLIVVDPVGAAPGEVVALTFPQETTRGILFVLEREVGDGWQLQYYLTSDGPGAGWERTWQAAGADGMAVEDIGVGGPGPDRVLIPDVAEPGSYRICTGNAGDEICTPIEILGG